MAIVQIKCNSCGKSYSYKCSDLDWDCVETHERNMGQENHYEASIEETCSCDNSMSIIFGCWEYPLGAENHSEVEVNGAQLVVNECDSCPNFN